MIQRIAALALAAALSASCGSAQAPKREQPVAAPVPVPVVRATIVARYPHDARAFTQGLLWHDGQLYESTGQYGQSEVRRVALADGKVLARAKLPPRLFGEGLARWRDELVSVTWQGGEGFRWDLKTLRQNSAFRYAGEGWGLTCDGANLILSDGTATLRFMDPKSFAERKRLVVTFEGKPLDQLNELEFVRGEIFANIWHSNFVARIDPRSGRVTGLIDLSPLAAELALADREAVLNGIAWDAKRERLFVTGKYWPTLFEIRIDR